MDTTKLPAVLVIDDEVNVVNALKRSLRSENFDVYVSTNPVEAIEIAKRIRPAAVVCDMRMPGMDGSQVFAALQLQNPDCSKILLTGYADINSTIAAINEGHIDRYLTKPWNDDELREVLRQQLAFVQLRVERDELANSLKLKVGELEELNKELDQRVASRTQEIYQTNLFLEQAYKELHTQFINAVKVFSNLIEMSSPLMAGHGKRVAELARSLALEMDLPEAEVQDIYVAGLLHDIGKMHLPEKILTTPYIDLDPNNRQAIVKHCHKGQLALMALPELHNVAQYVAHHHERVDGRGYPGGLNATEIPRGARVLAVAEDWDELQMGLLTGKKMNTDQALDFIRQGSQKRYDDSVVRVLPSALIRMRTLPGTHELMVDSHTLSPGQKLSRDLYNPDGMLLMAKGGCVTDKLVQYLSAIYLKEKVTFKVYCDANLKAQNNSILGSPV
ncbi:MAG: response regulator [Limnobacter sp.]|nr:response regulator [Limnobacter sp.]